MLDICEKYSINPMEFDHIPEEVKKMMIAKYRLDVESKVRSQNNNQNR